MLPITEEPSFCVPTAALIETARRSWDALFPGEEVPQFDTEEAFLAWANSAQLGSGHSPPPPVFLAEAAPQPAPRPRGSAAAQPPDARATVRVEDASGMSWEHGSVARAKTIGDLAPTLHRLKSVGGSSSRHVLPASASVGAAAHHLLSERLSFSLILRSDESLLGMVTERDLLRYATQAGDLSGRTSSPRAYRVSKPLPSKPAVVEWMTPADRALTVRLDDTLEHAVSLVRRGIWRHLPVVDYYGRIHSILDVRDAVEVVFGARGLDAWRGKTAADVLGHKRKRKLAWPPPGVPFEGWQQLEGYLLHSAAQHTVSSAASVEEAAQQMRSFLSYCAEPPGSGLSLVERRAAPGSGRSVASIMAPLEGVLHVSINASVGDIVDLFFAHNMRHLPVIDRGRLLGIISARDLLLPLL
ncbi:hypothetical protein EMIHUDRAFT_195141 [Emiliania huxleyi CCMP1516]|uniref:CBS domain-containing protein n=2 Tax=Emiliania huxleyi TaxID=2903 RepID=A0A0D3JGZ1_EMIH1|nr:hypothetical protein EMIHUDRAFT_195141 [Emiliania huxleyi CCMP1516]EOD22776.1 hypothetical protein EMIHUDRAFT_195141 [Emiliania huxleyi CCMP1516]|eukprot:XP_005775205.1 hypothetical protein EMIHUDRAFT_195141 [Emiliania huxleyi CCMP1516]